MMTSWWRHTHILPKSLIWAIISWFQKTTEPKCVTGGCFLVKTNLLRTKWGVNRLSICFFSKVMAAASLVLFYREICQFGAKMMTSSWRHHHNGVKVYIFWKYIGSFIIIPKSGVVACFNKILDRGGNFTPPNHLTYMEKPNHNRVKGELRGQKSCLFYCSKRK